MFAAVLMVIPSPKVTGPETVTLLPTALDVVILPLSVTPPVPVKATVLIPLVCVPIAPTVTVFVPALSVTSSEEVPSIFRALIAPLFVTTERSAPLLSAMFEFANETPAAAVEVVKLAPVAEVMLIF